jgi:hypothetical protein
MRNFPLRNVRGSLRPIPVHRSTKKTATKQPFVACGRLTSLTDELAVALKEFTMCEWYSCHAPLQVFGHLKRGAAQLRICRGTGNPAD